jgi:hypothetical protein
MATQYIEIYATATEDGPLGIRLDVDTSRKPAACPGLGGWKRDPDMETWWTRVKGQQATDLGHDLAGGFGCAFGLRVAPSGKILSRAQYRGVDDPEILIGMANIGTLIWRRMD